MTPALPSFNPTPKMNENGCLVIILLICLLLWLATVFG